MVNIASPLNQRNNHKTPVVYMPAACWHIAIAGDKYES
ncbi:hypothetical protein ACIN5087_0590 [Acinetobacter baumannii OIFC087]|nr:hypothetical protein ACIN5032_0474 [Acinetobacter baumannii OIFC032]EKP40641.1 hypothetical protein ACIN5087_0590 [Acinetobacter baumannii OIFC087]EXA56574.1 hypothetical protein J505_2463 [Acinetobacter baumannii 1297549]EXH89244.1 hypothetical protein J606_2113 [Acinetobacter baumannii 318814]